jgi:excisionase family DNA binding protein
VKRDHVQPAPGNDGNESPTAHALPLVPTTAPTPAADPLVRAAAERYAAKLPLTVAEAAAVLGVSRGKVYQLVNSRELRASTIGRKTVIRPAEIDGYLERHAVGRETTAVTPEQVELLKRDLLQALVRGPCKARQLARRAGYPFDRVFRQAVVDLVKAGLLVQDAAGSVSLAAGTGGAAEEE